MMETKRGVRRGSTDKSPAGRPGEARGLAALAGVGLTAQSIHRDRVRLVGLRRKAAERHGRRREAFDDLVDRLDLLYRDRLAVGVEFEQPTEGLEVLVLVVDEFGELQIAVVVAAPNRLLERADRLGVPLVVDS